MRARTALAAAVVVGAGAAAARRRSASREPVLPPEPLPAPLQGRVLEHTTADGVRLHVEAHGPDDAAATVVLAHGYTQSSRLWDGTVRDLLAARDDLRVVVYDHRGHGRSGRSTQDTATIEQLGRDLAALLDEVVPTGPVVLGGHSMGGMTLMALAEQRPDIFGGRVVGAAFLGTSTGDLDAVDWGLPKPLVPVFKKLLPIANEKAWKDEQRGVPRKQIAWFEQHVNFARGADPAAVREVLAVQKECTAETMHFFLATFSDHDRVAALEALREVPALVLVGADDRLCPVAHSRAIADALPKSELVVVPGAGHMVHLERRSVVAGHLSRLLDRALGAPAAKAPQEAPADAPAAPPLARSWS